MIKLEDVNNILNRVLKNDRDQDQESVRRERKDDDFWSPGNSDII